MIIIDTHIWIWFNSDSKQLPAEVAMAFRDDGVDIAISSVSVWEAVLVAEKGRIETALTPEANARAWLAKNPIEVIPVDTEIAILARTLPFEHSDPADRFIAATAYRLGCPLATVDERLRRLPWLKTLP